VSQQELGCELADEEEEMNEVVELFAYRIGYVA
jgi:hypothetical protein